MGEEEVTAIDAVRKRPGMYVGDTHDGSGILNMLLEIIGNAYDHYLGGRCTQITVEVGSDGTVAVEDDGPGMLARGGHGIPPLERALTQRSEQPTLDGHRPHIHLGLGGLGMFVVNALSERFELLSVRDGVEVTTACARGQIVQPITERSTNRASGTRIQFRADPEIFRYPRVSRMELARHLEDLSFLAPGLALTWSVKGHDFAKDGLAARVALAVPCELHEVAKHQGAYTTTKGPIDVEVALAWRRRPWDANREFVIDSFVNLARTRCDGSHVDGLVAGTAAFFGGEVKSLTRGLVAAVSVVLADVKFGEPDRSRLDTLEARAPVADATKTALEAWAVAHPDLAADIRKRYSEQGTTR